MCIYLQPPIYKSPRSPGTAGYIESVQQRPQSAHPGYTNPIYAPTQLTHESPLRSHYYATEPLQAMDVDIRTPAQIRAALQPQDYTSIEMDARVFAPESLRDEAAYDTTYRLRSRSSDNLTDIERRAAAQRSTVVDMSPPGASSNRHARTSNGAAGSPGRVSGGSPRRGGSPGHGESRGVRTLPNGQPASVSGRSPRNQTLPTVQLNSAWDATSTERAPDQHLHRQPRASDLDEEDMIDRVMQPGVTSAPLVASIRTELQRLSAVSPPKDTINTFQP